MPRPRGKGFRGGGRGNYGGEGGNWRGHRGGGYRGGGRGGGHRGGRVDHYRGNREMHGGPHHPQHDPEKLLSSLGPEAQLALTTAIINSVLKTDGREGRSSYREREYRPHHRDARRDGRGGGYFREESRERRHYGEDRRSHEPRPYHEEGRGHHYDRDKSTSGSPRYRNNRYSGMPRRRPSPHGHPGPSRKRQRMERLDSIEGDSSPHHETQYEGEEGSDLERERSRERKHRSPGHDRERKGREGDGRKSEDEKEDGPGGVQVTIRADGERAVNNEGRDHQRVGGRLIVELRCPHCSNQRSITFKEYKYHLGSEEHKSQLNRLARKHSVVLRKIRVQQRQEQRDIEAKWKEDQAEEFKSSVTRFCNTCKLAFKCLGGNTGEGISLHNSSKLHRMQKCYLHPRCSICRITFPSRMVYEYHIASISHLRVRTASIDRMGGSHRSDDQDQDDEDDELDLANFMTLDSVGEDDEVGSEHEEITGGLDEVEVAKEAESRRRRKESVGSDTYGRTGSNDVVDEDEVSVEADWDKEQQEEDEDEEENEAVGSDYVNRVEAYFCSLCSKIIRADTSLGSRAVQRHCRSFDHLSHYQDAHPPIPPSPEYDASSAGEGDGDDEGDAKADDGDAKAEDGDAKAEDGDEEKATEEVDEAEAEMEEEDEEQDKLWEEVDKGLNMLQGEIMTEIDDSSNIAESKETTRDSEEETEDNIKDADEDEDNNKMDEDEDNNKMDEDEDNNKMDEDEDNNKVDEDEDNNKVDEDDAEKEGEEEEQEEEEVETTEDEKKTSVDKHDGNLTPTTDLLEEIAQDSDEEN